MTLILNEYQCNEFNQIARKKNIRGGVILNGRGTVNNAILNLLGIKSQKRIVINVPIEKSRAAEVLEHITEELQLHKPGHGIIYTTPIMIADQIIHDKQGDFNTVSGMEGDSMFIKLTVVVDRGMSDDVMDIARKAGVRGGTVLRGRGTGAEFVEVLFGNEIEPEKELVTILLPRELKDKVVNDLYSELRLDLPGNGILYVEPISEVRGLFETHLNQKDPE